MFCAGFALGLIVGPIVIVCVILPNWYELHCALNGRISNF
jgi:hypothetical protein